MKTLITLLLAALCAISVMPAQALTTEVGVYDSGRDGDEHFYRIRCNSERSLMLTVNKKKQTACFLGRKDKEQCLKTTKVRSAGLQACQATD